MKINTQSMWSLNVSSAQKNVFQITVLQTLSSIYLLLYSLKKLLQNTKDSNSCTNLWKHLVLLLVLRKLSKV
jgi:hypothetical protein